MKKLIAMLLVLTMALSFAACGESGKTDSTTKPTTAPTTVPTTAPTTGGEEKKAMTYAEYIAAEVGKTVTVECYVQATQGWWFDSQEANHGVISIYAQDKDGGYFLYNTLCEEADAKKLTEGTKIRVTGDKIEWDGQTEIKNGKIEFVEGDTFVAEYTDRTDLLGTDDLIKHQNEKFAFKGLTVVASNDQGAAFLYKWNGSGTAGDDLYFKVALGDKEITLCVESYLAADGTAAYEAVEALKVGDKIDVEGFLYLYQGVQPHITSVTKAA